jgi:hypothetical protein
MSELPDPYSSLPLSDDELKTVAKIAINWAHADTIIGHALVKVYSIDIDAGWRAAKDLIHSLEMARKINLLFSLKKENAIPATADFYLTELKYAQDNFKTVRNVLFHGTIIADDKGNWSGNSPRGPKFDAKELSLALEQSRYAGLIANRLLLAVHGFPLPTTSLERPPKQLPQ